MNINEEKIIQFLKNINNDLDDSITLSNKVLKYIPKKFHELDSIYDLPYDWWIDMNDTINNMQTKHILPVIKNDDIKQQLKYPITKKSPKIN